MAFSINEFKAQGLTFGGARPTLFQVEVVPPPILGFDPNFIQKFTFTCRAAELPASDVASFDVPYFGRKVKLAGDRTFADWRVTIMNDEDFLVRALFEKWSNSINTMQSNLRLYQPALAQGYKSDLLITQFGKAGNLLRSYGVVGAFPTVVDAISLDWNSTNAVEEFSITFSYDYWVPVDQATNPIVYDGSEAGI